MEVVATLDVGAEDSATVTVTTTVEAEALVRTAELLALVLWATLETLAAPTAGEAMEVGNAEVVCADCVWADELAERTGATEELGDEDATEDDAPATRDVDTALDS